MAQYSENSGLAEGQQVDGEVQKHHTSAVDELRAGFASDAKAQPTVQEGLSQQPKSFFEDGIKELVSHWNTCIVKQGNYGEK